MQCQVLTEVRHWFQGPKKHVGTCARSTSGPRDILEGLIEEESSSYLKGCIEFQKAGQGILQ